MALVSLEKPRFDNAMGDRQVGFSREENERKTQWRRPRKAKMLYFGRRIFFMFTCDNILQCFDAVTTNTSGYKNMGGGGRGWRKKAPASTMFSVERTKEKKKEKKIVAVLRTTVAKKKKKMENKHI